MVLIFPRALLVILVVCRRAEGNSSVDHHAFLRLALHAYFDDDDMPIVDIDVLFSLTGFGRNELCDKTIVGLAFSVAAGVLRPTILGDAVGWQRHDGEGISGNKRECAYPIILCDGVNATLPLSVLQ